MADGAGDEDEDYYDEDIWDDGIDEDDVVIFDNGSGLCKAGLSSDREPTHVFPEVVGVPRRETDRLQKDLYIGNEATEAQVNLTLHYPLENGIIEKFEEMHQIWEYTYDELLEANPQRHPLLLTEPPYNPRPNRERMVEIMFEEFRVPCLNVSIQGVLALLGQGRMTGLVLDSGEGVTHTIPIWNGFGLPHCIKRMDVAGAELNVLLAKLIAAGGRSLAKTRDMLQVRAMKEQHCYVALDPSTEVAERERYTLPDGSTVVLRDERWRTPEALFNPSIVGQEADSPGVAGMVWDSIQGCDIDLRRQLLSNVVLSGGSTMFPGFAERLTRELRYCAPTATQAGIRVVSSAEQRYAVWSGAQVFAGLKSMQEDQWMHYQDYEEHGAALIHDRILIRHQ